MAAQRPVKGLEKVFRRMAQYRVEKRETHLEEFQKWATKQEPEILFIGCSDSRVVQGMVTDTGPGDLFIHRNIGNCVPPSPAPGSAAAAGDGGASQGTAAVLEYSLGALPVRHIIVCGHSECGAMHGVAATNVPVLEGMAKDGCGPAEGQAATAAEHYRASSFDGLRSSPAFKNVRDWLTQQAVNSLTAMAGTKTGQPLRFPSEGLATWSKDEKVPETAECVLDPEVSFHDNLSRVNAIQQIQHLMSYPVVQEKVRSGDLTLHAWWKDVGTANIYAYSMSKKGFILLDETQCKEYADSLNELD